MFGRESKHFLSNKSMKIDLKYLFATWSIKIMFLWNCTWNFFCIRNKMFYFNLLPWNFPWDKLNLLQIGSKIDFRLILLLWRLWNICVVGIGFRLLVIRNQLIKIKCYDGAPRSYHFLRDSGNTTVVTTSRIVESVNMVRLVW